MDRKTAALLHTNHACGVVVNAMTHARGASRFCLDWEKHPSSERGTGWLSKVSTVKKKN